MATMMTRTRAPAAVVSSRNIRSAPNRWPRGRAPPPPETGASAGVVVSDCSAMVSAQAADRGGNLGLQLRRQRRVADLAQLGLAVGAGDVAEEALDERQLVGRGALGADDLVGDQDDRVRPGLLGGVVDGQRQVGLGTGDLRAGDRLAGRLVVERGVLTGTVVDLRREQAVGLHERVLDVADRTRRLLHRGRDAVGLGAALATGG